MSTKNVNGAVRPVVLDAATSTYIPQTFDPASVQIARNPAEAAEHARAAAFQAGYNDGLEQARAAVEEATQDSNRRVRRAMASLQEAVDLFDQREATALGVVEDAIVVAAFGIAQAIVQHELRATTDPGAEAIARALKITPGRDDVVAHLHPEDAATLNLDSVATNHRNIIVVADASIEPGGCLLEAGDSRIDSQFSAIFANVANALGLSLELAGSSSPSSRTTASEAPLS